MGHRRHAADRKACVLAHELRRGALDRLAQRRRHARLVDAPVAGGDDQHRATTGDGAKDQRLGDLTDRDAERIGRLLGGARRHRQFDDLHGHAGGQQRRLHPLRGSRERPAGSLAHTVRPPATSITAPLM